MLNITSVEEVATRFWAKTKEGPNGCLLWTRAVNAYGYGVFRVGQRTARAHRVAYELVHGPIPAGLILRHSCHNPLCVNPEHLKPGTRADNARDMIEAGRQPTGPGSKPRKLTDADAVAILGAWVGGLSLKEAMQIYGVGIQTAAGIRAGRCWAAAIEAHIDAELAAGPPHVIAATLDLDALDPAAT